VAVQFLMRSARILHSAVSRISALIDQHTQMFGSQFNRSINALNKGEAFRRQGSPTGCGMNFSCIGLTRDLPHMNG